MVMNQQPRPAHDERLVGQQKEKGHEQQRLEDVHTPIEKEVINDSCQ
jgi:hypothetical protein